MTEVDWDEVDWDGWSPVDLATLVFVVRDGEILLIRKKRGLGAGKINGPGGRLEEGETPLEGAVREAVEEVRVEPYGLVEGGRLRFHFLDGYRLLVHVFRAAGCEGEPEETDEADPAWFALDAIPWDEMWPDDRVWLPRLLAGEPFDARFVYDGEEMLWWELDVAD